MPKNIVILSDGTGQEGGKSTRRNTNVYKLFNMLEDRTPRQVVFYDRGVGTSWRKLSGNAGGFGMSRNIRQAYRFLLDNYEAGDRIYLIGFSRGAATVRSLSGFIHHFGVLPKSRPELVKKAYGIYRTKAPITKWWARRKINKHNLANEEALVDALYYGDFDTEVARVMDFPSSDPTLSHGTDTRVLANAAANAAEDREAALLQRHKQFRDAARQLLSEFSDGSGVISSPKKFIRRLKLERRARAFVAANNNQWAGIEFLGCFDTVPALGVPWPALDAVINRIPSLHHKFHDFSLARSVRHAYHALAIDDQRKVFAPRIWAEPAGEGQTLTQVWFTGMHTDVGGGYEERGLADISLAWMLRKAHEHGLLIYGGHRESIVEDCTDVMHDSRGKPLTKVYRAKDRAWDEPAPCSVHQSVLLRRRADTVRVVAKKAVVDTAGGDYKPWILDGGVAGDRFHVEPWVPYDRDELVAEQEIRWSAWVRGTEAWHQERLQSQQEAWKKIQADRRRDPDYPNYPL